MPSPAGQRPPPASADHRHCCLDGAPAPGSSCPVLHKGRRRVPRPAATRTRHPAEAVCTLSGRGTLLPWHGGSRCRACRASPVPSLPRRPGSGGGGEAATCGTYACTSDGWRRLPLWWKGEAGGRRKIRRSRKGEEEEGEGEGKWTHKRHSCSMWRSWAVLLHSPLLPSLPSFLPLSCHALRRVLMGAAAPEDAP